MDAVAESFTQHLEFIFMLIFWQNFAKSVEFADGVGQKLGTHTSFST